MTDFVELAAEVTREVGLLFPRVIRVLMVDDNENDIGLVRRVLETQERTTYRLDSVGQVDPMASVMTRSHDVYLVDVKIGRFNGLELIEQAVKAEHRGPFMVLTGSMIPDADEVAARAGAIDFVDKGEILQARHLDRKIRYAIKNYRIQETYRRRIKRLEDALKGAQI